MPALLPKTSLLYEEGENFIDGRVRHFMLEDTPDGFICTEDDESHGNNTGDIAPEIKCLYPDEAKVTVHYKVPVYCVLQLLCHMKAKNVMKAWYASYSEQSVVIIEVKLDEQVWDKAYELICDQYDKENISSPKGKVKYRDELKLILQEYLDNNSKLLLEVPSMKVTDELSKLEKGDGPYYIPPMPNYINVSPQSIAAKLKSICRTTCDLIQETYELQRRKVTEILAFVISDTDRIHDGQHPNQIPVTYTSKGYSLSTDTLCK